jgi:uncharacterized protein (TIGR02246 family)
VTSSSDSDIRAIEQIREDTMRAENAGDADFFMSACTEDVVVMPPNMQTVAGREAAVGFMRALLSQCDLSIRYISEETTIDKDLAYDRGTYSQTLTPKGGGASVPENGKFLWLYARASDGSWKMSRVIWNSSEAPSGSSGT